LWALSEPHRISPLVRKAIESADNDVFFSAASIWEIATKASIGRLTIEMAVEEIIGVAERTSFQELPVLSVHAAATETLPLHHRDPFDRLLIAQAMQEPALITADRRLAVYSDLVHVIA
jgi:PIN domain nuclease of toxin-antitoxin system